MNAFITRLRGALRAFGGADEGNIAIIFALAILPVMGLIGASVDYSQASAVRANLQAAVDSTALMISKTATSKSATEVQTSANSYFQEVFNAREGEAGKVTATYTSDGGSAVTVIGTTSVKNAFMAIIGYQKLNVSASSTVKWGNTRLRVALVLDVTGSMASAGKIAALKTAAKNLLTQLKGAATVDGDVYVSIIPFAKDVNVDATNKTQSWISWALWDEANGSCSKSSWRDSYNTKSACKSAGGNWTVDRASWAGCVTDRDQSHDTTNAPPVTAIVATLFPAEEYSYCPVPLMALSYNWTTLNSKITAMQPNGGTNQAIGLQWGFQSLTSAPFVIPIKDSKFTYQQVIILLSDGLNTQDRWYGNGTTPSTQVDDRQKILCTNVKAAGITLYTVQVNTDGDPTSTLLKNCASGLDKFFLLTSANQMVGTFNQIGTALSNLRIAK